MRADVFPVNTSLTILLAANLSDPGRVPIGDAQPFNTIQPQFPQRERKRIGRVVLLDMVTIRKGDAQSRFRSLRVCLGSICDTLLSGTGRSESLSRRDIDAALPLL
jgi:hypothetical protein